MQCQFQREMNRRLPRTTRLTYYLRAFAGVLQPAPPRRPPELGLDPPLRAGIEGPPKKSRARPDASVRPSSHPSRPPESRPQLLRFRSSPLSTGVATTSYVVHSSTRPGSPLGSRRRHSSDSIHYCKSLGITNFEGSCHLSEFTLRRKFSSNRVTDSSLSRIVGMTLRSISSYRLFHSIHRAPASPPTAPRREPISCATPLITTLDFSSESFKLLNDSLTSLREETKVLDAASE